MENLILYFAAIIFACYGFDPANALTCSEEGLFENTDETDCKTFVSCGYSSQPQVHSCPENSFFSPEKKGCFSQYDCATRSMPGNPCEGVSQYQIPDPSSPDCSKYIQCDQGNVYNDYNFQYPKVLSVQCGAGSAFRPGYGCVSGYKCANYPCTEEGLFPNSDSVDCTTFIECWKLNFWTSSGTVSTFHSNVIPCPSNTRFNPYLKKCDSFYICGQNNPHGGNDPCQGTNNWDNKMVPNPFDSTQKTYLTCRYQDSVGYPPWTSVNREGILKTDCPPKTYFTSLLKKCYSAHKPNENCSKDPCSSGPGQYFDYHSGGCQSFIECKDKSNDGITYKPNYEIRFCPPGTLFAQTVGTTTGECEAEYSCPNFDANYCYPAIVPTTTTAAGR